VYLDQVQQDQLLPLPEHLNLERLERLNLEHLNLEHLNLEHLNLEHLSLGHLSLEHLNLELLNLNLELLNLNLVVLLLPPEYHSRLVLLLLQEVHQIIGNSNFKFLSIILEFQLIFFFKLF
jgi:hypothetical protein